MKKENYNGIITLWSDEKDIFINSMTAIMAASQMQMYFAMQGYLVTSSMNSDNNAISVTVHFEMSKPPKDPHGYLYTRKEITSHTYWSMAEKALIRVRCVEYRFKFAKAAH